MTTTYTFEQLKEDVRKEAEALKIHATKEERERLCLKLLDPEHKERCYYGLMTGNCDSDRAIQLIELCACRYIKDNAISFIAKQGFERIQRCVNGDKVDNLFKSRREFFSDGHFSAIEAYILLPEANNASLIAFLRGETETLEL
jgi:hypothetical protein